MTKHDKIHDGLRNVVAGLGTDRDKAHLSEYVFSPMVEQQAITIYRSSWLARKIVDIPAADAFREWREWSDEKVEAEENRLHLKQKMISALVRARLTGGSAILIGADIENMDRPLDPTQIGAGGIKYLSVLSKSQLTPSPLVFDVSDDRFMKPEKYTLNGAGGSMMDIHPSRLVILSGIPVVDPLYATWTWGDSVLTSMIDTIRNFDAIMGNISSMVYEAKVDTIGIPGLMQNIASPEYETKLIARLKLAEIGKGVNGAYVHDAEEILGQKSANFSALPDLIEKYMKAAAGAADIPMTRLMGQSPAGMSSTGESDLRNYYDRISAMQGVEISPAMAILDAAIVTSSGAAADAGFKWCSLWQESDASRADIGEKIADVASKLVMSGIIPEGPLSSAVVTAMSSMGVLPHLKHEMDEYFAANPDDPLADPV